MKFFSSFVLVFCLLLTAATSYADEEPVRAVNTPLFVEVSGLGNAQGNIYIAVYDSRDTWLGETTVLTQQVAIAEALTDGLVRTELQLPPGDYALSIFHDSNNNGELDTNFIGIPKEPVALSNNARSKYGPPKYKNAVFRLGTKPSIQRISIEKI